MTKHRKNGQIGGNSLAMVKRHFPKVESVEDADKPIIVEVTDDDVAHANIKDHETCALAIACKRSFKADGVIIGMTHVNYQGQGGNTLPQRWHSQPRNLHSTARQGSMWDSISWHRPARPTG
jgi:hypothetical protein